MQINRKYLKKLGIYLIIVLVVLKFLIIPLHKELEVKKDLLAKKINQYKVAQSLNFSQKRVNSADFHKLFDSHEDYHLIQSVLLGNIKDFCQKNNLTLLNYDLPNANRYDQISEVSLVINLEGDPHKFIELLKTLKKYPKIIEIKRLEMHASENKYNFMITLTTYKLEK